MRKLYNYRALYLNVDNFIYTRPSTPRRGAATIGRIDTICGTWNAERGTRYSMPPKGVRRYVTLTQDIDPPKGVRHIVTY